MICTITKGEISKIFSRRGSFFVLLRKTSFRTWSKNALDLLVRF